MVATKEQAAMGSAKDHHHHNNQYQQQPHPLSIKGKRTKRPPRTASPAALATVSSSLVSPTASAASNYSGTDEGIDAPVTTATATSSTTTASAEYPSSHINGSVSTTAEEEDMANCLILLAQSSNSNHHVTDCKINRQNLTEVSRHQQQPTASVPVTAPKVTAPTTMMVSGTAAATTSSSSIAPTARPVNYAYECKTCNRSFPSFQALGGHRASHRKPKQSPPPPTDLDGKQITQLSPFSDHDGQFKPSLSLQIGTTDSSNNHHNHTPAAATNSTSTVPLINKSKVHECTICGAEFSSGQALGGHMRRHRTLLSAANASAASASAAVSALQPMMIGSDTARNQNHVEEQDDVKRTRNLLSLDLNLPAPEDDYRGGDEQQQQQSFVFKSSDKTLFFSASSLVDCHY